MVALITPSSLHLPRRPLPASVASPPQLRLIRGGADVPARDRSVLVMVAAVLGVLGLFAGLRMLQGQPPAAPAEVSAVVDGSAGAGVAGAQSGEAVRVVAAGDTLWAIANDLAPGRDPRPVVDALADRNGGSTLRAGDLLVIPGELLVTDGSVVIAAGALD